MSKDNVFEASFLIYILFQDNFRSVSIFRRSLQIAGQEDWVGGVPDYDRSTSATKGANSSQWKVLIERILNLSRVCIFFLFVSCLRIFSLRQSCKIWTSWATWHLQLKRRSNCLTFGSHDSWWMQEIVMIFNSQSRVQSQKRLKLLRVREQKRHRLLALGGLFQICTSLIFVIVPFCVLVHFSF